MKRMHVHVSVENIDQSIAFYSRLFATEPTVAKADYAKWMLDDPRVNFAISSHCGATRGIEHLGIQVEDSGELGDIYARLADAGQPVMEEGATTCCYARSEKSWTADPDGVIWEAFLTQGDSTVYGGSPDFSALTSINAASGNCCAPETAPRTGAETASSCAAPSSTCNTAAS